MAISGAQINYADATRTPPPERQATSQPKTPYYLQMAIVVREGKFYPYLKILGDFMESLPFWRMKPQPRLANTGMCLAEPGEEYVVYTLDGGRVVTDLTAAGGSFSARWLNPRTGQFAERLEVKGNSKPLLAAPDENDWVLHIKREK